VLDGGYPSTAPMIMASIAKLGFNIKDVKVLLSSRAALRREVDPVVLRRSGSSRAA